MIIYDSSVQQFIENSKDPYQLAEKIQTQLLEKFGIRVADNEFQSWMASLPRVANLLRTDSSDFRKVLVEFNIPTSKQRIDFIVLGKDSNNKPSAWILELKQWNKVTEVEWNEFQIGKYIDSHPSDQARDYQFRLEHEMGLAEKVNMKSAAYLHNLTNNDSVLFKHTYQDILKLSMLYGAHTEKELSKLIEEHTINKDGTEAFELFGGAKWNPTKKFIDAVKNDFNDLKLVGSQKLIYDKIERFLKEKTKSEKMTFLISGDPGSGKTVVAFKLSMLLAKTFRMKSQLIIPGQEVRAAFKHNVKDKILSSSISGASVKYGFDAAIIDEAHKATSRDTGLVNYQRMYEKLNFAIVFIDDDQVINKKGVMKDQVRKIAEQNGHVVHEYKIEENFRSAGERALLDWIDYVFYGRKSINGDYEYSQEKYVNKSWNYKLHGYKNADDFVASYYSLRNSNDSTRLTSLWHCSFYTGPADAKGDVPAYVPIGNHKFVWNPNGEWASKFKDQLNFNTYNSEVKKFANDRKQFLTGNPKPEYIAYFNHIQGFEFENIYVYIPNVFTYRNGEILFHVEKLADEVRISQPWSLTSSSKELAGRDVMQLNKRYFLNRIKVMLTRGTKSTHVFAEDEALNEFIRNTIEE